jgi:hypothetical protein
MRLISYEVLIQAIQERGLDEVYAVLERLFMEEPLVFLNADGEAIFSPFDELELWGYLEVLFNKEVVL